MRKYDAVVIGAGNGGLTAAIRLLQGGARVRTSSTTSVPPTTRATSACSSTNSE